MKSLITMVLLSTLLSCSSGVEGFREIKIGSSLEELKSTSMCSSPKKNNFVTNLEAYECKDVEIEGKKYPLMVYFNDAEIVRIAIQLDFKPNKAKALDFFDALSGQYGKPSKSRSSFEGDIYPLTVKLNSPIKGQALVSWNNNTVKIWVNNDFTILFYDSSNFGDIIKESNAKKKSL